MSSGAERRTAHRYGLAGTVKIFRMGLPGDTPGKILDLCRGGCLLDVGSAVELVQDSEIELLIQSKGISFRLKGKVRRRGKAVTPVGIAFAAMTRRVQQDVDDLIAELEDLRQKEHRERSVEATVEAVQVERRKRDVERPGEVGRRKPVEAAPEAAASEGASPPAGAAPDGAAVAAPESASKRAGGRRMPYIDTPDGTRIYYTDWGAGAPVVLIHGWPLNSDSWDVQANFLAEHGVRVITYDRRGFGRSDKPWNGYDYDTLAADLHALLETLALTDATLVGFSMGGGEVVRYLSKYGSAGRVSKAVLVSAVTPYLLKTDSNPDGVDAKVFEDIETQIRKDRPAFLESFGPKFYGRSVVNHTVSEAQLQWTLQMALTATTRSTLATAKSWATTDFREEMKRITIPVRVIHGTSDHTVPIDASGRRAAKLLPNATLSEYDGEPHGLFLTAADKLNEELLQFVAGAREPLSNPSIAQMMPPF